MTKREQVLLSKIHLKNSTVSTTARTIDICKKFDYSYFASQLRGLSVYLANKKPKKVDFQRG